jgi:nucleotide-binding universal stress UspA family protein
MIKRILLPLDPSDYTKKATELACNIAKHHNAELAGMVVLDVPGIASSIGPVPARASFYAKELQKARINEADNRIKELLEDFKSFCDAKGVLHSEAYVQGIPSEMIVEEAKYFDILVIGKRTFFHFETQDDDGDSFGEILDSSSTPVIAVPKQSDCSAFIEDKTKVLIAVDGKNNSARAMHRFAYLMKDGIAEIDLLISHEDEAYCNSVLDKSEAYLSSHGFTNINKVKTKENIIDYIDNNYINSVDLFVIGEHNKNTFADFFMGSFSKYIIENSKHLIMIGQ